MRFIVLTTVAGLAACAPRYVAQRQSSYVAYHSPSHLAGRASAWDDCARNDQACPDPPPDNSGSQHIPALLPYVGVGAPSY